ncbi:hypothetical protein [Antrihabitans spumae]|uniref:Tat pathway signal protein n=1 Tax=Antrihabitans spumae TaxID=3373370 RepID=A0ABW7K3X2_9NOCA
MLTSFTTGSVSRRSALRLAGFGALGTVGVASLPACGAGADDSAPAPVDVLIAQRDRADRDSNLATAAVAAMPDRGQALTSIAAERTAHRDALDTEIARAAGTYDDGSTPAANRGSTTGGTATPVTPPDLDELRTRLTESARSASNLARTESGYRAGLLGSISACCTTQVGVLLR